MLNAKNKNNNQKIGNKTNKNNNNNNQKTQTNLQTKKPQALQPKWKTQVGKNVYIFFSFSI